MCGIGGVVLLNKKKGMDEELQVNVMSLLCELQDRGTSAWGIYLKKVKNNHNLYCGKKDDSLKGELFKTKESVTEFFGHKGSKLYLDGTNLILMHTRASTQGAAEYNENNHPFNTENFILAHNGGVVNDSTVMTKFKIKNDKNIQCDSYAIVSLIQHFFNSGKSVVESIKLTCKEITGGMACWLYHKDTGNLYLWRNSNPIEYAFDEESGTFVFASVGRYIKRAYNGAIEERDIHTLESDIIFKLENNELKEVGKLEEHTYSQTQESNYTGNRNHISTPLNLNSINSSLVYLYKLFEMHEKGNSIKTVIAIVRNEIILLVKPPELLQLLDGCGFDKYKKTKQIYKDDFYKYTIAPKEDINKLVKILKQKLDGVSDDDDNGDDDDDNEVVDPDKRTFHKVLKDMCETLQCELEEFSDKHIVLKYAEEMDIDEEVIAKFQKVGLHFDKDKKITMINTEFHREKLEILFKEMKLL